MPEPEWWEDTDEEKEARRKQVAATNSANPEGHAWKPYIQGYSNEGVWLGGAGELTDIGRSTTMEDRAHYIKEAREAGASDEYMQDFLARNTGDYSRLKRVWLDETVDQPDSNTPGVDPDTNYNYATSGQSDHGDDDEDDDDDGGGTTTTPTTTTPTTTTPTVNTKPLTPLTKWEDWKPPTSSTDWRNFTPTATPLTPTVPTHVPGGGGPIAVPDMAVHEDLPIESVALPPSALGPRPDPNTERTRTALLASQAQDKARSDALWATLGGRANQSLVVDRNDPILRAQADAYGANESRASSDYLADLAEGSSPNANLLGEQRLAAERRGQRTGAFEAELMGRELSARRDEIAGALAGQGAMLTADQQRSLTQELALMDNAIKEQQLGLTERGQNMDYTLGQGRLGLDTELGRGRLDIDRGTLGLNEELGRGRLNLDTKGQEMDWRRTLMEDEQFGASQAQDWQNSLMQNEQYGRTLGQNQDQFGRTLEQAWKEAMLRNEQFQQQLGFDASRFASDDDYRRSYIK